MSKITDYTVVSALYAEADADYSYDRLSKQVNDHIQAGWQPHGQIAASTFAGTLVIMQVMVRYDE
ncbi:MAG TPA: hypothetical protein DEO85_07980 [Maritimibacter sp.]|nr:hypothetical protein [Maritimibacter sp.]